MFWILLSGFCQQIQIIPPMIIKTLMHLVWRDVETIWLVVMSFNQQRNFPPAAGELIFVTPQASTRGRERISSLVEGRQTEQRRSFLRLHSPYSCRSSRPRRTPLRPSACRWWRCSTGWCTPVTTPQLVRLIIHKQRLSLYTPQFYLV